MMSCRLYILVSCDEGTFRTNVFEIVGKALYRISMAKYHVVAPEEEKRTPQTELHFEGRLPQPSRAAQAQ